MNCPKMNYNHPFPLITDMDLTSGETDDESMEK